MTHKQAGTPILLLMARDDRHPFDMYLEEILLTEGYNCYDRRTDDVNVSAGELAQYALVVFSSGAAAKMNQEAVAAYMSGGGKVVVLKPPRDWATLFGLTTAGDKYSIAPDAYISVNTDHPWMGQLPAPDLQCPGENDIYANEHAEVLAFTAGQLHQRSVFPAVALERTGHGAGVVFTYDLADCIVLAHQGRAANASTGTNPDANRDGKFTADDAFVGMRDFQLRHVPQSDVHQDILVRVIRGLTQDALPLPRLWHFPRSAPGVFFVNGDGDGMVWEDLLWVVDAIQPFGVKYTFYFMDRQIEDFSREQVAEMVARGHDFGPHPWTGAMPGMAEWRSEVRGIVSRFKAKFGFQPTSLRSHSTVFPGWDETPRVFTECGLRLDTSFAAGVRWTSGYLNGSALPAKFIDRNGNVLDCYEQSTIQTEDGTCSPKNQLPVATEDEALELSRGLIRNTAEVFHGAYHPYFHPISLAGRGSVSCQRWFKGVLQATRDYGLPSVNAGEWLKFNDARRAVQIQQVVWNPHAGELTFEISARLPVAGLTVMLPPCGDRTPQSATMDREPLAVAPVAHERLGWSVVEMDLGAGASRSVAVHYATQSN